MGLLDALFGKKRIQRPSRVREFTVLYGSQAVAEAVRQYGNREIFFKDQKQTVFVTQTDPSARGQMPRDATLQISLVCPKHGQKHVWSAQFHFMTPRYQGNPRLSCGCFFTLLYASCGNPGSHGVFFDIDLNQRKGDPDFSITDVWYGHGGPPTPQQVSSQAAPGPNSGTTEPSKTTVHFFYGHHETFDPQLLKKMARQISKNDGLPDSSLFFYQIYPWQIDAKEHGLKVIRETGRYPAGNVGVFEGTGELDVGPLQKVPFCCLTLVAGFEIKTVAAADVPPEVKKLLGL